MRNRRRLGPRYMAPRVPAISLPLPCGVGGCVFVAAGVNSAQGSRSRHNRVQGGRLQRSGRRAGLMETILIMLAGLVLLAIMVNPYGVLAIVLDLLWGQHR